MKDTTHKNEKDIQKDSVSSIEAIIFLKSNCLKFQFAPSLLYVYKSTTDFSKVLK